MEDLRGKKPNAEWLAAFTPWEGTATDEDWAGPLVDLFSPDYLTAERKPWDTPELYPNSRRFIDLRDGELQVSEDLGDGSQVQPVPNQPRAEKKERETTNFWRESKKQDSSDRGRGLHKPD